MELLEKLTILSDSAKYDASCASSGADRKETGRWGRTTLRGYATAGLLTAAAYLY